MNASIIDFKPKRKVVGQRETPPPATTGFYPLDIYLGGLYVWGVFLGVFK